MEARTDKQTSKKGRRWSQRFAKWARLHQLLPLTKSRPLVERFAPATFISRRFLITPSGTEPSVTKRVKVH